MESIDEAFGALGGGVVGRWGSWDDGDVTRETAGFER